MDQVIPVLQDMKILICRPQPAADELKNVFDTLGAEAMSFPCIDIRQLEVEPSDRQKILDLDQYASVIVTSQHAARSMVELVDEYWAQAPLEQQWFSLGPQTSLLLKKADLNVCDTEQALTSEGFWDAFGTRFVGQKVLLCKGLGGRDLLNEKLSTSAERLDILELYERARPGYAEQEIDQAIKNFAPYVVIALSAETLENYASFAKQIGASLSSQNVLVSSERVAEIARKLGFAFVNVADNLRPIDLIKAVRKTYFA